MKARKGFVWSRTAAAITGVALFGASAVLGAGAAGALDTSFGGGDGLVTTSGAGTALDVVVQPVGTSERYLVAGTPWTVLAYTSAGDLDTTFGPGGDGVAPLFTSDASPMAYDLSLDGQNRVVVGGTSTVRTVTTYDRKGRPVSTQSYRGMTVVRLTADGHLDTSFNGTGIATVWAGSPDGYNETGVAATAVPDALGGGVVAAGTCYYVQTPATKKAAAVINKRMFLARFQDDGTLDSTFGTNGIAYESRSSEPRPVGLALQGDGSIVVAERTEFTAGTNTPANTWVVSRFTPDGALDASFGTNGRVVISSGAWVSRLQVAAGDDSIVACGGGTVARYLADGTPDASFDGDGYAVVAGGTNGTLAVAAQSDGLVVFCGLTVVDSVYYGLVGRLDGAGSADAAFGTDGYAPLLAGWWAQSAAEATDGIVVAGSAGSGSGQIFVARYGK